MKPLTIGLGVATVALGAISIYQAIELHAAREPAPSRPVALVMPGIPLGKGATANATATAGSFSFGPSATIPTATTPPSTTTASENRERDIRLAPGSEVFSTPEGREVARLQARVYNNKLYAGEFKKLALSSTQVDALLNLLSDQEVRQMEAMRASGGDRAAAEKVRAELQSRSASEIDSLLGSAKGTEFDAYVASMPQRRQVNIYADQLEALNLPMTDAQKDQFVSALTEAKQNLQDEPQPSGMRDVQGFKARMEWEANYNRSVLESASSVLTAEQYDHVRAAQEAQMALQQQMLQRRLQRIAVEGNNPAPPTPATGRGPR